jgi:ACS family allantoate permease-like MFS transporter
MQHTLDIYLQFLTKRIIVALQRLPLAKFLSSQIVIWGAILMFHALCKEFASLMAVRILLGMFEASITPAFILIVSQWWQKEEHGLRTGIWFCCNGFGQILGAVVSYGIAVGIKNNGYTALAGWQIMFLFTGSLTVLCGILFYFIVPDSPATAWFLSREEKVMALERIRGNQQGVGNKHFKKYQIYAALKDPFVSLEAFHHTKTRPSNHCRHGYSSPFQSAQTL